MSKHPFQKLANSANTIAEKLGQPEKITPQQLDELWLKDGGRCWFCLAETDHPLDNEYKTPSLANHLRPLSGIGENVIANIRFCCKKCADIKKDSPDWFYECAIHGRNKFVQANKD